MLLSCTPWQYLERNPFLWQELTFVDFWEEEGGGREAQIGFTSPLSVWRVRDSRQKCWIYKEGLSRRLDANTPSLSLGLVCFKHEKRILQPCTDTVGVQIAMLCRNSNVGYKCQYWVRIQVQWTFWLWQWRVLKLSTLSDPDSLCYNNVRNTRQKIRCKLCRCHQNRKGRG